MAGRFPRYTDENVKGALIKALRQGGWDVVRAIEVFPEGTDDEVHLEHAVKEDWVLVTNNEPLQATAHQWLSKGKDDSCAHRMASGEVQTHDDWRDRSKVRGASRERPTLPR